MVEIRYMPIIQMMSKFIWKYKVEIIIEKIWSNIDKIYDKDSRYVKKKAMCNYGQSMPI